MCVFEKLLIAQKNAVAEFEYQERQREIDFEYNKHLRQLEREKAQFIKDNPDFPKETVDIMFLNVIAPRQNYKIKYI